MKPTVLIDHEGPAADGSIVVRALLRLEGEAPTNEGRVPLNLSVVLDRSGSMSGPKLAAARDAAQHLIRRLWPEDRVSVVAYDDAVQVVAPPSVAGEAPDLGRRIDAIYPGGCTNLSGGWLKGRELTAEHRASGAMNRILLLTDGLANVGITDADALAGLCHSAAKDGVTTTTIGFGVDFDEALLRAMADAGCGNTYYIEEADQAAGVFQEEIEGLLSLSAQNLSVDLRAGADVRNVLVLHTYPREDLPDGVRLTLGDLYAREPKTLLVQFHVAGPSGADELDLGTLTIRGDVLTGGGVVERREVTCPVRMMPGSEPRVDEEVRHEILLLETARARDDALLRERSGDFRGAAMALRDVAGNLREHGVEGDARLEDEYQDLLRMAERADAGPMSAADKKYLFQRAYDSARGKKEAFRKITRRRD